MYSFIGNLVERAWPIILLLWIGLLLGLKWAAPSWDKVARHGDTEFLPATAPSRQGEELFDRAFSGQRPRSGVVIVVHREDGALTAEDRSLIADVLAPRLKELAKNPDYASAISEVRTFQDEGSGKLLDSPDQKASLVIVDLKNSFLDSRNWSAVSAVENVVADVRHDARSPAGLSVDLSGSGLLGRDVAQAQAKSAQATRSWTIIMVASLLLIIYRAPFLIVMPLATVYIAVEIALSLLSLLAGAGVLSLFEGIQIFITILGYGAGVDYCLFLTARFKEELERGVPPRKAVAIAVSRVGATVAASAATVICGIGMLVFATFGKYHEAGVVIPISLAIVLAAALTFSPSLLCLAGHWAFWPRMADTSAGLAVVKKPSGLWGRLLHGNPLEHIWEAVGRVLLRRPGAVWLMTVGILAPFCVIAMVWHGRLDYGVIDKLPKGSQAIVGTAALEKHFAPGVLGTTTILLQSDTFDFREPNGTKTIQELTARLQDRTHELGVADMRSLTAPLGTSAAAQASLTQLESLALPGQDIADIIRKRAQKYYVGGDAGHVARIELVSARDPFSTEGITQLEQIRQAVGPAVADNMPADTKFFVLGSAANLSDLHNVTASDQKLIGVLVPAGVFAILLLLLRSVTVSVYLVISVVFSYVSTLGTTIALFWLIHPRGFIGLDWQIPLFLFTILVAVGEDYNIFLMTRIHEEQKEHGKLKGIVAGLARSGGVISSCGFIMAGTFASLLAGSLIELKQMGFALAFGVLLDTMVVRPILVPAYLILWEKWWGTSANERLRQSQP